MAKKKLRLIDIILSIICVVFTIEACAPAAAIGNSSVFWWLFLLVTFLMPYGLIVAELGTTFDEGGAGVYEWVRDSMGRHWATREAWYYWVNYFTWLASCAILFPTTINAIIGFDMPLWAELGIELAFIWFVVWISLQDVGDLSWIMNGGAVIKVLTTLGIGFLGVWYVSQHGFATPLTLESMLPDFSDGNSLQYLSIIIYNYMGCEVVATFIGSMENPRKDMPKAIIVSGITIVAIYLFVSLGISCAIPHNEISLDSGIADAVGIMTGVGSVPFVLVCIGFLLSLAANMISWSHGVSSVTHQAAVEGNLPRIYKYEDKNGRHLGSGLMTGICTSALVLVGPLCDMAGIGFFQIALSLDVVFTLAAYLPMFPAFLRLRELAPDKHRPFRVPGGKVMNWLFCWVPVAELVVTIVITTVPLGFEESELEKVPLLIAVIMTIIIGEVVRHVSHKHALVRAERGGYTLPAAKMGPDTGWHPRSRGGFVGHRSSSKKK